MKYMVITKKWDDKKKAVVNYVCGEFPEYWLASNVKGVNRNGNCKSNGFNEPVL